MEIIPILSGTLPLSDIGLCQIPEALQNMKAQAVPWCSRHVMRHSFASICASKGIDIYRIATWLGDDVRVVQRHYAKLRPDDREIMKAFRV